MVTDETMRWTMVVLTTLVHIPSCLTMSLNQYPLHNISGRNPIRCRAIRCPKGTVPQLCTPGQPNTTYCKRCDPETHYSDRELSSLDGIFTCSLKDICTINKGLKLFRNNDNTKNRECVCDMELFYYNLHHDRVHSGPSECRYCPDRNDYVHFEDGCIKCKGKIFLDESGYKRCGTNSSLDDPDDADGHTSSGLTPAADSEQRDHKDGLSQEQTAVVVGAVVAVFIIIAVVILWYLFCKKRRHRAHRTPGNDGEEATETDPLPVDRSFGQTQNSQLQKKDGGILNGHVQNGRVGNGDMVNMSVMDDAKHNDCHMSDMTQNGPHINGDIRNGEVTSGRAQNERVFNADNHNVETLHGSIQNGRVMNAHNHDGSVTNVPIETVNVVSDNKHDSPAETGISCSVQNERSEDDRGQKLHEQSDDNQRPDSVDDRPVIDELRGPDADNPNEESKLLGSVSDASDRDSTIYDFRTNDSPLPHQRSTSSLADGQPHGTTNINITITNAKGRQGDIIINCHSNGASDRGPVTQSATTPQGSSSNRSSASRSHQTVYTLREATDH